MKNLIKKILQRLFGFRNYLFVFSLYIIKTLKYNKNEKDFLIFLEMLPDKGSIIDIGANIGIMTVHLARKKPNAKIFSFEPIPSNIEALKRVVKYFKLKNVTVFENALGASASKTIMVMPVVGSVKMQGLSHVVHESIPELNEGLKFEVEIRKLDDFEVFKDSENPVVAIKIDVENFEYFVFQGAESVIEKNRPIVYCELWNNENRGKCIDYFLNKNYSVMIQDNGKLVPFDIEKHQKQNFFFIPVEKNRFVKSC